MMNISVSAEVSL